jgi:hypothetical protein
MKISIHLSGKSTRNFQEWCNLKYGVTKCHLKVLCFLCTNVSVCTAHTVKMTLLQPL